MSVDLVADFAFAFPAGPTVRVALEVPPGITAILGPSGGGKTTALRCLAGLARPQSGSIRCGPEVWFDSSANVHLRPQQRGIGYLFQEAAMFPHLTAAANVGYALPRRERATRVAELLAAFGLAELAHRYPRELSGGQRQRVALARAVAGNPQAYLLDEPLAALDAPTRERLRPELRRRLLDTGRPCVLVTHDRTDAIAIADRIAVLIDGAIVQVGPVPTVFARPASAAVAELVGVETVLPGRVREVRDGLATVEVGTAILAAIAIDPPADVLVCIRGEDVTLHPGETATSARNRLPAVVVSVRSEGPLVRVELDVGFALVALVTRPACEELGLVMGARVVASVKAPAVHWVPR